MILELVLGCSAFAAAPPRLVDPKPLSLKKLVDLSDGIFVGRVARIATLHVELPQEDPPGPRRTGPARIAELEVREVLRGRATRERVFFFAPAAEVGEETLLFLRHLPQHEPSAELLSAVGAEPLWYDTHSGLGHMRLYEEDERWYAERDDRVAPPKSLSAGDGLPASWVELRALSKWIAKRLRKSPLPAPAHPEHGMPARYALYLATPDADGVPREPELICAAWDDGDFVYSKNGVGGGEPYRREELSGARLRALSEELEDASDGWKDLQDRFETEDLVDTRSYHLVVRDWDTRELVRVPAGTTIRDRGWHRAVEALLDLRPWWGDPQDKFELVLR